MIGTLITSMPRAAWRSRFLVFCGATLIACQTADAQSESELRFTVAVIPDTQNMVDFERQTAEGFPVDGASMFVQQMQYLAENTTMHGGPIAFVTSVGDVWSSQTGEVDTEHLSRGIQRFEFDRYPDPNHVEAILEAVEIPTVKRGYDLLANAGVPFSVIPGNHDYDGAWLDQNFPPDFSRIGELMNDAGRIIRLDTAVVGMEHVGGLTRFAREFGDRSTYFAGQSWYLDSFNSGANSAQVFSAGGHVFLHIGLEMQPGDGALAWAQGVVDQNPGLPTIISTHDFLNGDGLRAPLVASDLAQVDPLGHNSAQDVWRDFISPNDQIFMVLSGHQTGQAFRSDKNTAGHLVYQVMANYQGRGHAAAPTDSGDGPIKGIGDGWLRLMEFDFTSTLPTISVRTYSTHFRQYSDELAEYADWYKAREKPRMSDQEFNEADSFLINLVDFRDRFAER